MIEELSDYVIDHYYGYDSYDHRYKTGGHLHSCFAMLAKSHTDGGRDLIEEGGPGYLQSLRIIQVRVEPERIGKMVCSKQNSAHMVILIVTRQQNAIFC